MSQNNRKRISLGVLVLVGVGLGLLIKNIKIGMIVGLVLGVAIATLSGKRN
ncbi:MAG: hypothetical protein QM610_03645 [Chitinophagaceae bacterium]